MDLSVALAAGDASLQIAPAIGGSITGFTWRGAPVLRTMSQDAIAARDVRSCACYPLVPYSNRIRDAMLHFGGRTHALAHNFGSHPNSIHGVGWQRPWSIASQNTGSVELLLRHDAAKDPAGWPWSFEARHALMLSTRENGAATLDATLTLRSLADEPFPFGLGWHPFFPKRRETALQFAARGVWRNDATQLPVEVEPITAGPSASPQDDRGFDFSSARSLEGVVLDNVFTGWNGHADLEQPDMTVGIDADSACRWLIVYAPDGRDFVAVEPVSHETDAFNRAAAGAANTGMRVLRPGASFSCTMRVTAAP